jgi:transposase-like protein
MCPRRSQIELILLRPGPGETRGFMQQVRVAARRRYTRGEKLRTVLGGFRREVTVRDLCRREGIKPGVFACHFQRQGRVSGD